jgi:tetratricopeptide (TPR) repeat protein
VSQLAGDLDLADRAAVDRYYARQLDRMVESAQHAGVPILLVTVADNLLRSIPGAASPPERAQLDAFERDRGHLSPEALAARIAGLPDGVAYAALYYHFGVSLLDAGRPESAMFYLERAERLDPDPARSSYTLRAALKEIAERRGAAVCDLAAELPRYSARGVPGPDLFWDHCHFTAPGHRAVAHILAACIAKDQLLPQLDASALAAAVSESDDPWRVDSWEGNPPQPAAGDTAHQDALRETLDGHALLAGAHADRAFDRYSAALTAGGPAGAGHLDRALSRMYNNETDPPGSGSRTALAPLQADLELAAKGFPDDPWVQDLWALWR